MDAELNQQCQCELCRPNWMLGQDDSFFERTPVPEQPAAPKEGVWKLDDLLVRLATG